MTNEKRCCIIYSQGKESLSASKIRRKERMDRLTRQRALILDIIRSDKCHHTAEELFTLAKERMPGISRATVYNNLHALAEEKIIRRISGDGASDRYDSAYMPHGHLVCIGCDKMVDFEIPGFSDLICERLGESIDSYELKVRYVCPNCKKLTYAAVNE